MESIREPAAEEAGAGRPEAGWRHYSTGRLTAAQAGLVDAWRARLREDRPLPGQPGVSAMARLAGASDRPRASCSDVIAAAVADVLRRQPPAPPDLARYAYAGLAAQQAAGRGEAAPDAATFPPVSFYLPAGLAGEAERLRADALTAVHEARQQVRRRALELHPGRTRLAAIARSLFTAGELARLGLPFTRQIPAGTIARMAVSRWADRSPDSAAAAAAAYAAEVHDQPHRARADMRGLRT